MVNTWQNMISILNMYREYAVHLLLSQSLCCVVLCCVLCKLYQKTHKHTCVLHSAENNHTQYPDCFLGPRKLIRRDCECVKQSESLQLQIRIRIKFSCIKWWWECHYFCWSQSKDIQPSYGNALNKSSSPKIGCFLLHFNDVQINNLFAYLSIHSGIHTPKTMDLRFRHRENWLKHKIKMKTKTKLYFCENIASRLLAVILARRWFDLIKYIKFVVIVVDIYATIILLSVPKLWIVLWTRSLLLMKNQLKYADQDEPKTWHFHLHLTKNSSTRIQK